MSTPARVPTFVVAGRDPRLRGRLVATLQADRPAVGSAGVQAGTAAVPAESGQDAFRVAGGCVCCLSGPAFRVTLARVLRAEPWERLFIEVDGAGRPERVMDQLRAPPFDAHLDVAPPVLALAADERLAEPAVDGAFAFAGEFRVALPRDGGVPAPRPDLEAAGPWPRRETTDAATRRDGWRRFEPWPAVDDPSTGRLARAWPAVRRIDRRQAAALLDDLAAEPAVAGLLALTRTSRAWYRWQSGEEGQVLADETGWRVDSRITVRLRPAAWSDHSSVIARLAALDRAFEADHEAGGSATGH